MLRVKGESRHREQLCACGQRCRLTIWRRTSSSVVTNNTVRRMNDGWVCGGLKWSQAARERERERVNSISQNNLHLTPALKTHQTQTHLMAALDDKWRGESVQGLCGKEQLTDQRIHPVTFRALQQLLNNLPLSLPGFCLHSSLSQFGSEKHHYNFGLARMLSLILPDLKSIFPQKQLHMSTCKVIVEEKSRPTWCQPKSILSGAVHFITAAGDVGFQWSTCQKLKAGLLEWFYKRLWNKDWKIVVSICEQSFWMPPVVDVSWSINNVERIKKTWIKSEPVMPCAALFRRWKWQAGLRIAQVVDEIG